MNLLAQSFHSFADISNKFKRLYNLYNYMQLTTLSHMGVPGPTLNKIIQNKDDTSLLRWRAFLMFVK